MIISQNDGHVWDENPGDPDRVQEKRRLKRVY